LQLRLLGRGFILLGRPQGRVKLNLGRYLKDVLVQSPSSSGNDKLFSADFQKSARS
jgi:hypothetical protein